MTPEQRACTHERFGARVDVNRLIDTGRFQCDIAVRCVRCNVPFSFVGPPYGLLLAGPAVSVDRTELRIPIEPGPTVLPMGGEMRFEVPQKAKES